MKSFAICSFPLLRDRAYSRIYSVSAGTMSTTPRLAGLSPETPMKKTPMVHLTKQTGRGFSGMGSTVCGLNRVGCMNRVSMVANVTCPKCAALALIASTTVGAVHERNG